MNLSKFDEVIRVNPFHAKLETDGYNIQFEASGGTTEIKDFRDFAEKMLRKYGHVSDAGDGNSRPFVVWSNKHRQFVESVGSSGIFYADDINNAFQFPDEESARECAELLDATVVLQWL